MSTARVIETVLPPSRRWIILAAGTFAQLSTSCLIFGLPVLVPALQREEGISLFSATVLTSSPILGLLLAYLVWGSIIDRFDEKWPMVIGSFLCGSIVVASSLTLDGPPLAVALVLAGGLGASAGVGSGRAVVRWFNPDERGLAMGLRLLSQPAGTAIAAAAVLPIADWAGPSHAMLLPALLCIIGSAAIAICVPAPPHEERDAQQSSPGSPYKGNLFLVRLHVGSALLVVPQFALTTFMLVYLVHDLHWPAVRAGLFVAVAQGVGAFARVVTGTVSDRLGQRLGLMRAMALLITLLMAAVAAVTQTDSTVIVWLFAIASVLTVAVAVLGQIAAAESAGRRWQGRVIAAHSGASTAAALVTGPALSLVVSGTGFPVAFGVSSLVALVAVVITPARRKQ